VFGTGSPSARLMIVGEAPGFDEDRQGEPFVGKAGQMLDRMLANVLKLGRADVYISNVVKCRPPDNRNPQGEEIARCAPYLRAQLRLVNPDVVLVLGSVATRTLFQTTSGVKRLRGQWQELAWEGGKARALATFHPAYLLRQPQDKRLTFQDLQAVKQALDGSSG
jgi:uracil-DNA glycosylase